MDDQLQQARRYSSHVYSLFGVSTSCNAASEPTTNRSVARSLLERDVTDYYSYTTIGWSMDRPLELLPISVYVLRGVQDGGRESCTSGSIRFEVSESVVQGIPGRHRVFMIRDND